MTPKQALRILTHAIRNRLQVLLKGAPGVGKSALWAQAAQQAGADLVLMHPAIDDPVDYKGLPAVADGGEHATFLPYGRLQRLITAGQPTVAVLDDFGQADESVQKATMQLIHGRRLNGHVLPDHVVFGAATNDVKQQAGVRGLIEPVKSRFHLIVQVDVSKADWQEWALDAGVPPLVVAFMDSPLAVLPDNRHLLFAWEPTKDIVAQPCPRTWEFFGQLYASGIREEAVWAGCVGAPAAAAFAQFEQLATHCPTNDEILADPHGTAVPTEPALCYLVAANLAGALRQSNFGTGMTYLQRLEQPYRFLTLQAVNRREAKAQAEGRLRMNERILLTDAWRAWATGEGAKLANANY